MYPLANLYELRTEMVSKEKAVIVIPFSYTAILPNGNQQLIHYFIAICLLTHDEKLLTKNKYALVRLNFMKQNNLEDNLDCYANSIKITAGLTELRTFLGIPYQKDGFGWEKHFLETLGKHIPVQIPNHSTPEEDNAILRTICIHEKRDPNRIYRYYIFRNGVVNGHQRHRTEYNAQLASHRFPVLYSKFKDDKTISFAFTDNPEDECTEETILARFVKEENK